MGHSLGTAHALRKGAGFGAIGADLLSALPIAILMEAPVNS
jgi:hypothetical protein